MDIFMKILLLLIGLFIFYVGFRMTFYSKRVIQGIQRYKYHQVATPSKSEMTLSRVLGVLLMLFSLYFIVIAIVTLL